jgi:L-asparaginase
VGAAVIASQTLPYGIYIAMNGRVYSWDKVKRNTNTGQFIEG